MGLDERNAVLNQKIDDTDLPNAVATLIKDAHRRKRQLTVLTISIILDLALTIGLGFVSIRTHNLAATAENNKQAILRNCQTSNEARANNKQLWDYLLNLPTPNAPTLQQQQVRIQFGAYVDKTFAPRNCSKM